MKYKDNIEWLKSLKRQIGQTQHRDLWHFEQVIDETIENLKPLAKLHGRLIDADALVNRIENNYCNKCTTVEECGICVCQNCGVDTLFDEIENATTIIKAEVSE